MARSLPSLEYLRELFDLDRETGILTWRARPASHFKDGRRGHSAESIAAAFNREFAGARAGTIKGNGYRYVNINGRSYKCSRIVWMLAKGLDPASALIDHRDRNQLNDAPANLRIATPSQNMQNRAPQRNSASGLIGVNFSKRLRKWRAETTVCGRNKFLGSFSRAADAYERVYATKLAEAGEFMPNIPPPGSLSVGPKTS